MGNEAEKTQMQAILDSYPESEPLLEFDDFFVGGNTQISQPQESTGVYQLMNMRNLSDLKSKPVAADLEHVLQVEDDLDEFVEDPIKLLDSASYESIFLKGKRSAYERFGYLQIKSCKSDVPLRERDLLLTEDDIYLIEHLCSITVDYFAVEHMAELCAYREMGIDTVSFRHRDGCPLCLAFEGLFFSIEEAFTTVPYGMH